MRIGIMPGLNAADGGIHQYSLTMLHALEGCKAISGDNFAVFASKMRHPAVTALRERGWTVNPLAPPTLKRQAVDLAERLVGPGPRHAALKLASRLLHRNNAAIDPNKITFNSELDRWFRRNGVELMLYPITSSLSFETRIPYVMTIHDLQHRLQPEFPEVSANGEWQFREYLFRNGVRFATLLLAESEEGKEDILNFYGQNGITPDRIKVLPMLPSSMLASEVSSADRERLCKAYHLPERYLFYPAQFWPHKNHIRIVEALGLLKRKHGLCIPMVFCGFHTGEIREQTFRQVMAVVDQAQIEEQIQYIGYARNEDMSALYAGARALVMPTFFGATNIPPLEAWTLGCPVLTSDIRGIRQQVGEAAVLVDPRSVESISRGIYKLWTDDELCRVLKEKGAARVASFTLDDYCDRLAEIIEEAKSRVQLGATGYA